MPAGPRPPELVRPTGRNTGRRVFEAQCHGACASCADPITPGDDIFYAPNAEAPSGVVCCGEKTDEELEPTARADDGLSAEDDPREAIARVLPRGKTAADRCGKCFQIPASNGTCGCNT